MADNTLHEQLIARIKTLTDEDARALLGMIDALHPAKDSHSYDRAKDPLIGGMHGPQDLSKRAKEILRDDIDRRSGWTQKERKP